MMGAIGTALSLAMLAGSGWVLARHGFGQSSPMARGLAAFVIAWAWMTVGAETLGMLGWLQAGPMVEWSGAGLAIAGVVWILRRSRPDAMTRDRWTWPGLGATVALGLIFWAWLRLGVPTLLYPVKVVSDGPIYHLYFAARWWKAGRIFLVASPFGEVGAPYFWSNGELWFTWLMTLWGGDLLAKLGQVPFLVVSVLGAYAMARRLGAGVSSSLIASAWFATNEALVLFAFEPNVDVCFIAGYLLACFFFLRYALRDDGLAALILGALAAGLGMGTKPTGIVFFPPLIAILGFVVLTRKASIGSKVAHLACLLLLPVTMFGFWPIRNTILTGNPLYPIQLEAFGRVWLSGWFTPDAMSRSMYYLPVGNVRALVDILMVVLDPRQVPIWVAAITGAWFAGRRDLEHARFVRGIVILAVLNVALYWLAIPYRTQQRFMLQAVGLMVVPLALLFDRGRWLRGLGLLILIIHVLTPQVWPIASTEGAIPWDLDETIPNIASNPVPIPLDSASLRKQMARPDALHLLYGTILMGLGSIPLAWAWLRTDRSGRSRRWAIPIVGTIGLACLVGWRLDGFSPLPVPAFPDYFVGWMELDSRTGPSGARIAYAGTKIPYFLMGRGLKNDVRYVNVNAHRDWLMHDYHRSAASEGYPTTWTNPFPGWDRLRPNYDAWLSNLRAEQIQILVVTPANPFEGRHNIADREGFPIERGWADAHPETFVPIYGILERDPKFRMYRVGPPRIR